MVIFRLFNTVGPRQTGQYGMVLARFVKAALAENQSGCMATVNKHAVFATSGMWLRDLRVSGNVAGRRKGV